MEEDKSYEIGRKNFDLPHDVVVLPSGGIFYKSKKKSIKVGYLTASDENLLIGASKNFTLQLLRNKIYEHDLRPEEMLEGDIEAILLFLRNTSFGTEMEISANDPKTNNRFKSTIDLGELSIIKGELPDSDGFFTTELPRTRDVVKLKPLTYGEILDMNEVFDNYPPTRVAPRVTLRLSKEIQSINDNTDKLHIAKYVESMPIADSKHIKKFLNENEPKLDLKRTIMTPSGDMTTVYAGFGVEFFRPFFGV